MLVLNRNQHEAMKLTCACGAEILIMHLESRGRAARYGIEAPESVKIQRCDRGGNEDAKTRNEAERDRRNVKKLDPDGDGNAKPTRRLVRGSTIPKSAQATPKKKRNSES